jgi:hypothetical protein
MPRKKKPPAAGPSAVRVARRFSWLLAVNVGDIIHFLADDFENQACDVAACRDVVSMAGWVQEATENHLLRRMARGHVRQGDDWKMPPREFSVAVTVDLRHVAIVVDNCSCIKPLSKAFDCVAPTLQRASPDASDEFRCYMCLEDIDKDCATCFNDHFCCGHLTCAGCADDVRRLDRCGMCRKEAPGDSDYLEELVRQARAEVASRGPDPQHDPVVVADVEAAIRAMGL